MYIVKCDECKRTIKHTDDVRESYAGGTCEQCMGGNDDAAPELMAIAKGFVALYENEPFKTALLSKKNNSVYELFCRASAVIAKAEGRP